MPKLTNGKYLVRKYKAFGSFQGVLQISDFSSENWQV